MTTLVKNFIAANPGVPGVPATPGYNLPGTPPVPPKPAYCIDIVTHHEQTYDYVVVTDPDTGELVIIPYSAGPKDVVTTTCYPATPGVAGVPGAFVPGVPGIPPVPPTPADFQIGWNASARSIASLSGDGQYTFSVSSDAVGVVTGLNDANNGSAYLDIDHAFYLASGVYSVIERGVKLGSSGSFTSSDVFAIARVGTQVRYFKNSALVYTSEALVSGTLFADASLYFGGDVIVDAALGAVDTDYAAETGQLAGVFGELLGFFSENDIGEFRNDVLGGMHGDFREDASLDGNMAGVLGGLSSFAFTDEFLDLAEVRGVLGNLTGVWAADGGIYALVGILPAMGGEFVTSDVPGSLSGVLGGMTFYGESGLLMPDFAAFDLALQTMTSFAIALAGMSAQLTGVLGSMRGFASTGPPDEGYIVPGDPPPIIPGSSPAAPDVDSLGDWVGRSGDQLRMLVGLFIDSEAIDAGAGVTQGVVVLPHPLLVNGRISGANDAVGNIILPSPLTTYGEGGWVAEATLPRLRVAGSITVQILVHGNIVLPMLTAAGTGIVGTIIGAADLPLELPMLTVAGRVSGTAAQGYAVLPALELVGSIVTNRALAGAVRLPRLRVDGTIITPFTIDPENPHRRVLQGHVVLPALRGFRTAYGAILLPRLAVVGLIETEDVAAIETRIAYAMNITTGAMTEFTNFPFRAMARAHNVYWGIGLDGNLYRMGGDLDDTAPIAWEWESGMADFGVWGQKGVKAVYIRAIFENGAVIKFRTDDAQRVYGHVFAGPYNTHKVHRIPFGRGVRTDSMAFGMANPNGGYLELDKVTPDYVILSRNL